jgi:hypothetical protein
VSNYVSYHDTTPALEGQQTTASSSSFSPIIPSVENDAPSSPLTPLSSPLEKGVNNNPLALGDKLRTHRLAIATTGEFTQANGGTPAMVMQWQCTIHRFDGSE